ncbi:lytic transglycosylase domain-containing protein [Bradyrhizobium sp. F1.13.3]|uniref:lytic transglycosylase domain-containing protein n=1 Tax=Bradyrhizobium sp. F1.13.3 TaxID=3156351 RepID=UPI00339A31CA
MAALLQWLAVSLVGRSHCHSSIPAELSAIGARRGRLAPSQCRPGRALSLAAVRALLSRAAACFLGILLTLGAPSACRAEVGSRTQAARFSNLLPGLAYAAFVTEAPHRFAVPERWIRAVMQAESGGNAHAMSPRGALGLMQIMTATWVELSVRHDLGIDPLDPHDNIMAGAAYLREMLDRFGSEGFLAAYNAGPKRYEEHLATGRPLPDETQIYIARLAPLIGFARRNSSGSGARRFTAWQQAPVLVERSESLSPDGNSASGVRTMKSSKAAPKPKAGATALVPRATGLFVRRSDEVQAR